MYCKKLNSPRLDFQGNLLHHQTTNICSIKRNQMLKQNLPPIKQGVFYQLNINKDSGAFLPKDIMLDNPTSRLLLTRSQNLHQQKHIGKSLAIIKHAGHFQQSSGQTTSSFNTVFNSCQQELTIFAKICKGLQISQYRFRVEIQQVYNKISALNNQILETSLPVLRNLMKQVKTSNQADKAEYYQISRELQRMEMEKRSLQHIFVDCQSRIDNIQKYLGIPPPQNKAQSMSVTFNYSNDD